MIARGHNYVGVNYCYIALLSVSINVLIPSFFYLLFYLLPIDSFVLYLYPWMKRRAERSVYFIHRFWRRLTEWPPSPMEEPGWQIHFHWRTKGNFRTSRESFRILHVNGKTLMQLADTRGNSSSVPSKEYHRSMRSNFRIRPPIWLTHNR